MVIESHTDGMNAVWDNGPVALLAMAEYFASLPIECRPRTLEFVFTTAHLYLSEAGAIQYAEMLDEDYDQGSVALVVALEHLGAKEYVARARSDGPGRRLEQSGQSEMFAIFSMESPLLVSTLIKQVVAHDLRRSWVLRGADAPQAGFPPHRSFGGEGGPYREQIVPTIAAITGPWTLFDPAFGMELVDFELMRRQTLAFVDVVLAVDDAPRAVIAGADTAYRAGRSLTTSGAIGGAVLHAPGGRSAIRRLTAVRLRRAWSASGSSSSTSASATGSRRSTSRPGASTSDAPRHVTCRRSSPPPQQSRASSRSGCRRSRASSER